MLRILIRTSKKEIKSRVLIKINTLAELSIHGVVAIWRCRLTIKKITSNITSQHTVVSGAYSVTFRAGRARESHSKLRINLEKRLEKLLKFGRHAWRRCFQTQIILKPTSLRWQIGSRRLCCWLLRWWLTSDTLRRMRKVKAD